MRVLVCEDHDDTREMLGIALRQKGWEVFLARDGQDGLRVYFNAIDDGGYFDVLLWDVLMPRLNGFAAGVIVRRFEEWSGIRRAAHVYLTGKRDVLDDPEQLLEVEFAGAVFADAYIHKPIGPAELIEQIEKLVTH